MDNKSVYIVTKSRAVDVVVGKEKTMMQTTFSTNEAVFATESEANDYIKKRKAAKDRDDRGCTFSIEPWFVGMPPAMK